LLGELLAGVLPDVAGEVAVPQAVTSAASAAPAIVRRPMCPICCACAEATVFPLLQRLHEPCVIGMTLDEWRRLGTFCRKL
jgi:hypothetical protein